jgi:integrase
VGAEQLVQAAVLELRHQDPQVFLALWLCFWGGLRKKEADLLTWDQVDSANRKIHVRRTQYFNVKTEESERDIDLPAGVMDVLMSFRGAKPHFVLEGNAPRPNSEWYHYRAEPTWRRLIAWLRSKGITEQKAVHVLRKESGSLIARQYGIEAARYHLGHRDISTTSRHYVTKLGRYEITLDHPTPARTTPAGGPAPSAD